MSNTLTLEDLKAETGVIDDQLIQKCIEQHLKKLAPFVSNYPKFASAFDLTGGDLSDIETDPKLSYTSKTEKVFLWWRNNSRNPTYSTFVQVCLDLREGGVAREMCRLCKGSSEGLLPPDGNPSKKQLVIKRPPTDPNVLTEADILIICEMLRSASKDWFNLGMALGMKFGDLKNIQDQYPDNNRRLTEVVGKRLEVTDPEHPVTWPYICECLRNRVVDRKDVANEIEAYVSSIAKKDVVQQSSH